MESTIKDRLERLMYELRYNQRQFAMAVGVSPQAINNVIAERTKTPSSDLLQAITKAFPQVNPTWLLTGTGSMLLEKELKEEKPVPQEMPSINPILEELKLMRQELGRAMRIIESQQELLRKHSGSRERTMPSVKKVA